MIFPSLSADILAVIAPFSLLFSASSWRTASTLLLGAILCRGKRTVASILRTLGLEKDTGFSKYHRILNALAWSPKKASEILLRMLLKLIGNERPVIFIDETLERRKGEKIRDKGYYRDAVRSSKSQVVNTMGLKWIVMALSVRFGFAKRQFALPFFSVLQPSAKSAEAQGRRYKTAMDWSIQMMKQLVRWIPKVPFILVGDGGFACGRLALACFKLNISLVSRLKMNAQLYALPDPAPRGKRGRKRIKGSRLTSFKDMVTMEGLGWQEAEIVCYSGQKKKVRFLTNTSMWGGDGFSPLAIRWVLMVDPTGELDPLPLMSTDVNLTAIQMIGLYVDRWNIEVTFEEVREHLGVETQRQWSDKAISRTTPILMGLYSIVCLIGRRLYEATPFMPEKTAWYDKQVVSFSDLLKAVRIALWKDSSFLRKERKEAYREIPLDARDDWQAWLVEMLAKAA